MTHAPALAPPLQSRDGIQMEKAKGVHHFCFVTSHCCLSFSLKSGRKSFFGNPKTGFREAPGILLVQKLIQKHDAVHTFAGGAGCHAAMLHCFVRRWLAPSG